MRLNIIKESIYLLMYKPVFFLIEQQTISYCSILPSFFRSSPYRWNSPSFQQKSPEDRAISHLVRNLVGLAGGGVFPDEERFVHHAEL